MKSLLRRNDKTPEEMQDSREKVMEKAFESLPLEGGAFRVFRKDDKGRMKVLGVLPFDEVTNPDEFLGTLEGRWGGGKYYALPTRSGKKSAEGFYVEFDGEPKKPKKKAYNEDDTTEKEKRSGKKSQVETELDEVKQQLKDLQEKERKDELRLMIREEIHSAIPKTDGTQAKLVNGLLSNFPSVVAGLSGIMGNRETAADMLEKVSTIWKNVEGTMPKIPDPVEQAKSLAELLFSLVERVKPPPIQSGGSSSGLASFVSSFVEQLSRKFVTDQSQGQPVPAFAGMQPQLQQAQPGFSGVPQGTPAQAPPGRQNSGQKAGVNQAQQSLFKNLGVDPLVKIRAMLKDRADPEDIAQHVVYTLDFLGTFLPPDSPFFPYITSFLDNPEQNFDKACASIPELVELTRQDPEYLAELKAAIVQGVQEYKKAVVQTEQAFRDMQAETEAEEPEPKAADVELKQQPADVDLKQPPEPARSE